MLKCKGCKDRHVGCHATCVEYIAWCEEREKTRDRHHDENEWKAYLATKKWGKHR